MVGGCGVAAGLFEVGRHPYSYICVKKKKKKKKNEHVLKHLSRIKLKDLKILCKIIVWLNIKHACAILPAVQIESRKMIFDAHFFQCMCMYNYNCMMHGHGPKLLSHLKCICGSLWPYSGPWYLGRLWPDMLH